jgi:hypothetical protein
VETTTLECPGETGAIIVSGETSLLFGNIPGDATGSLFLALKKFINTSFGLVVVVRVVLLSLFNVVVLAVEDDAGRERFKGLLSDEAVAGGFTSVPKSPPKASAISDGVSDNDERLRYSRFSYNFRRRFRSSLLRFWDEEVVFRMDSSSVKSPCGSSWLFDICPKIDTTKQSEFQNFENTQSNSDTTTVNRFKSLQKKQEIEYFGIHGGNLHVRSMHSRCPRVDRRAGGWIDEPRQADWSNADLNQILVSFLFLYFLSAEEAWVDFTKSNNKTMG